MSVVNVWSGGVGPSGATVVAKVTGTSCRLAVSASASLTSPTYVGPVTPTAQGIATFPVTGLAPNAPYWYAVEDGGVLDTDHIGRFHTHGPVGSPYSFTFAHATCAGENTGYPVAGALAPTRVSDHPVFDEIRAQDPLFFIHGGDLHYYNIGSGEYVPDSSLTTYRRAIDDVLLGRQGTLYRNVPLVYGWDDHDFGPNDSDRTAAGRANAAQVYRERVPSYPLAVGSGPIYHSFQVGRVLFIVTDGRYYRDPPAQAAPRAMFGATQLAWLDSVLASSTAAALCWVQEQLWTADTVGQSAWGSYAEERDQIVNSLRNRGWLSRMWMVQGDSHAMAIDTGASNTWGGFPLMMFSPLDSTPSPGPAWDIGHLGSTTGGGRGNWGTVRVTDTGSAIEVEGTGWRWS